MKELKAKTGGFAEVEKRLREQKAQKVGEEKERATYFDTEGRGGLCIIEGSGAPGRFEIPREGESPQKKAGGSGAEKKGGARVSLAAYNEEDGCFDIATYGIESASSARRVFARLFSNSGQVSLEKKVYSLEGMEAWLVHIDGLGNFVMIRDAKDDAEKLHDLLHRLGIGTEKIVKRNFGEMMFKNEEKI